jgi:ribosomal protein L17
MRVGQRTDFEKISLEIETDGTISPSEALKESLSILISHFNFLDEELKVEKTDEIVEEKKKLQKKQQRKNNMNKQKKGRKFNRKTDQRRALLKTLATSLILKGKIKTTEAKAKELSRFIEKKITKAKKSGVATLRYLRGYFSERTAKKLMEEVAPNIKKEKEDIQELLKWVKESQIALKWQ